jgi:protein YIPF5/7
MNWWVICRFVELGIDFKHIWMKLSLLMHPLRPVEETVLNDTDLAGPLVLACILGFCSLLAGKIHFGYIYGFGGIGCLAMYTILNLMNKTSVIDMSRVVSVLGYSMLPIVVLSAVNILFDLRYDGLVLVWWRCCLRSILGAVPLAGAGSAYF